MGALLPMRSWVAGGLETPGQVDLIHHGNGARTGIDLRRNEVMLEIIGPPEFGEAAHHTDLSRDPTSTRPDDLASAPATPGPGPSPSTSRSFANPTLRPRTPGLMIK
jgi:hypothetical protein